MFERDNFKIEVPCCLEFKSTKPVSKTDFITIIERNSGMKYVYTMSCHKLYMCSDDMSELVS